MEDVTTLRQIAQQMSMDDLQRDRRTCAESPENYDSWEVYTVRMVVTQEIARRDILDKLTRSYDQIQTSLRSLKKTTQKAYTALQEIQNPPK